MNDIEALKIENRHVMNAFKKLAPDDKELIDSLALGAVEKAHAMNALRGRKKAHFGKMSALELIAKIGIFFVENQIERIE